MVNGKTELVNLRTGVRYKMTILIVDDGISDSDLDEMALLIKNNNGLCIVNSAHEITMVIKSIDRPANIIPVDLPILIKDKKNWKSKKWFGRG